MSEFLCEEKSGVAENARRFSFMQVSVKRGCVVLSGTGN